jgi:hypothetical protein
MGDDHESDMEHRLAAIEFWLTTLLAAHLRANPTLDAAREDFDIRPLPDPQMVEATVQAILAKRPELSPDELAPETTDEAERHYLAVSRLLERARAIARDDEATDDQESPG